MTAPTDTSITPRPASPTPTADTLSGDAPGNVPTALASIGLRQWHLTGDPDRARIVVLFTVTLALGAVIATLVDTRTRRPVEPTDDTRPSID